MIQRDIFPVAFSEEWGRQMRFVAGPRQAGKTTLAKEKLRQARCTQNYYLWDRRDVRNRYRDNELFFTADSLAGAEKQWVCFDEIHKMPRWKNILKAIFDETAQRYNFIVTGSARLEAARRAGDSLSGRYFMFHLSTLCLREMRGGRQPPPFPPNTPHALIEQRLDRAGAAQAELESMLAFSGFPEPLLKQSRPFLRKWQQTYLDTVIKEDIGALTRILDREYLHDLCALLPQMVSSPISESSLAGHIGVSPATVKGYLRRLDEFYLTFRLRPYSRNIKRSLLRSAKCYLFDWTRVQNPAARFENYCASELRCLCDLWSDMTGDTYGLFYVRNRQKQETDFLLTRRDCPWMLLEAKQSDGAIDRHHHALAAHLGIPFVQLCQQKGIASIEKRGMYRISAARFF